MLFSSMTFVFLFLPIVATLYFLSRRELKNHVLLVASSVFYAWGEPDYLAIMIATIIINWAGALCIEKYRKKARSILSCTICADLSFLFYFKYFNFVVENINALCSADISLIDVVMPIGISFYTFQGISYIVDVYRGNAKAERSLPRFAVYISMFEQLIAGPIVTYGQVEKELYKRKIKLSSVLKGMGVFIFGLGLKVLLANPIGKLWSQTCAIGFESISTPLAWMAITAFSFQIYFDFFFFFLMAIGLGKMLGFKLPKNFEHPYTSLTMTEFWRRWHITLGAWFREYVYIPLGGNRNGKIATVRNLLIVWLLTGLWHGAGYNFVLWGAVLFLIIMLEKFFIGKYLNKNPVIARLYMIILIPITWAIFAIDDIGQLWVFFTRLFPFFGQGVWSIFRYDYIKYLNLYYPFFIAGILFSTRLPFRILKRIKSRVLIGLLLAVIFGASVYCMYRGFDDPFLYFRF